jgi:EAL domain-containing protein (putative c-di-GMP-specific phosphodiesterase class I)
MAMQFVSRHSLVTGACEGLEVQTHWPRPLRGAIGPAGAGPGGRLLAQGGRILRAACCEASTWPSPWRVVVAVADCQLAQGALLRQVAEALADSSLDPERLELEMTEHALLDADLDTLLVLAALRDLGVAIGLDEYGGGVTSLSLLRRMPLSGIKLDASLVRNLPADAEDRALVSALLAAAHGMGLQVVAAGVETESQRTFLCDSGCDIGQGRLFGGPAPAGSFRRG